MADAGEPSPAHHLSRRWLVALLVAFAVTRLAVGYVAANPDVYDEHHINASFELSNYHLVADRMLDKGDRPYEDFKLEYPPGEVPFFLALARFDPLGFEHEVIGLCVLADALGLYAVYRLARRTGSWWGVLAWLVLIPLVGPLSYSRTDIFVALALAWAFERAVAGRWAAVGAWIGFGVVMKITPVLVLPALLLVAPDRKRVVQGFVATAGLFLLPFAFQVNGMWRDVVVYHSDRGVQLESTFGILLASWRHLTGDATKAVFAFGGWEVTGGVVAMLKQVTTAALAFVLLDSVLAARLNVRRGEVRGLAVQLTATLTLLVAVSKVFSPQYMVWLIGILAVGLTLAPRELRATAVLLSAATLLTVIGFPFLFFELVALQGHALAVILVRDLCVLAAGLLASRAAWRLLVVDQPANAKQRSSISPSA